MRKTLFFLSCSLLLTASLYSCKKDEADTASLQSEIATQAAANQINNNVINWLDNQKTISKPKLKEHLELLMTNLELSKVKTEEFNNVDDFIAIPLNKNYNRIKKIDDRSRINLVVFAGKSGEIKGARIIELIPEEGNDLIEYPSDIFKKVVNKQFPGVNGTVKLSGLDGLLYREVTYKNGKLFSSGVVQKGDKKSDPSRMAEEGEVCTDWYLYETWCDEYGNIIDWELTYLYTSCEGGGGGGGGGGYDPGECSMTAAEAEAALASITSTISSNGSSETGYETGPDANGIIERPVVVKRHGLTYTFLGGKRATYTLYFPGKLFKTTANPQWKWKELTFSHIGISEGDPGPCYSATFTPALALTIDENKLNARFVAEISVTFKLLCPLSVYLKSKTESLSAVYPSSDF